jgi:hypothetical protein
MDKTENEYAISDYGDPVVVNVEVFDRGGLVGVDLWLYHHLENPNSFDSETVLVNYCTEWRGSNQLEFEIWNGKN